MPAALEVGEFGPLTVRKIDGCYMARQRVRLWTGELHEVKRKRARHAEAKAACQEAAREALQASEDRKRTGGALVGDVLGKWLDTLDRGRLSPSTVYAYKLNAARSIEGSTLACTPLSKVTRGKVFAHIQATADERGAGEAKMLRSILRGVFDLAVMEDLIGENPAHGLPPIRQPDTAKRKPKATTRKTDGEAKPAPVRDTARAFTREELADVLHSVTASDLAERHNLAVLVYVLAATGLRIGEASALRWSDIDWSAGTLDVHGTVVREKGRGVYVQDTTKTSAGMRRITLPGWLLDFLREHRRTHLPASEFVCATSVGTLRDPANTNKRLRDVLTEAGHDWATAHTFRKTVATLLDESGLSAREIASHLGHRDPSMTTDVYMDKRRQASAAGGAMSAFGPT